MEQSIEKMLEEAGNAYNVEVVDYHEG